MKTREKRALQAYRRIQTWLVAHPNIAAASAANAQLVQDLNDIVTQLTTVAGEQDGHDRAAQGAALEIRRARTEIVVHQMRHVAIVAEAAIPDVVKMTAALRRPVKTDNEALLLQADAMATAAEGFAPALEARGLAPEFVQQLRDAAQALRSAIDARGSSIALRHKAGEALDSLVKSGTRIVDTLTVVVQRAYRNDPVTLAEWTQLRRVVLPGSRPAQTTTSVIHAASPVAPTDPAVGNIAPPLTNGESSVPQQAAA